MVKIVWKNDSVPALNETNLNLLQSNIEEAYTKANGAAAKIEEIQQDVSEIKKLADILTNDQNDNNLVIGDKLNISALIKAFKGAKYEEVTGGSSHLTNFVEIWNGNDSDSRLIKLSEMAKRILNIYQADETTALVEREITISSTGTDRVILHLTPKSPSTSMTISGLSITENNLTGSPNLVTIADQDDIYAYDIEILRVLSNPSKQYIITETIYNQKGYALRSTRRIINIDTADSIKTIKVLNSVDMNYQLVAEGSPEQATNFIPNFNTSEFNYKLS